MSFSHLDHDTLRQWQDSGTAHEVVDIRDPMSFSQGHIQAVLTWTIRA